MGSLSLHSNRLHVESAKFLARSAVPKHRKERKIATKEGSVTVQGPGIKENIFKWKPGCYQHSGMGRAGGERMMGDPSIGSFSYRSLVRVLPLNSICHQWKTEKIICNGWGEALDGCASCIPDTCGLLSKFVFLYSLSYCLF